MSVLLSIIIASLIVSSFSLIGAFFLGDQKKFTHTLSVAFVSFAAGVMLSTAFFDLLPEALTAHSDPHNVLLYTFFGMTVFFFLERFVVWFHHHDGEHGKSPSAVLVLVGDTIHNMLDGVAIAAAFLVSPSLGIATTLALCAHEIPQEFADFAILIRGGFSTTKALVFNFLSGLGALFAAVIAYFFMQQMQNLEWKLLAFSAGMFLYISSADLIPELHQEFERDKKWRQVLPFVAGSILMWGMTKYLGV